MSATVTQIFLAQEPVTSGDEMAIVVLLYGSLHLVCRLLQEGCLLYVVVIEVVGVFALVTPCPALIHALQTCRVSADCGRPAVYGDK